MFVAKLPGSTYATQAMKAGPRNGQRPRSPRRLPASDASAASRTRASPGRTSSSGWTGASRSWRAPGMPSGLPDQEPRRPHGGDPREVAADRPTRAQAARRRPPHVPRDLDDDLEGRARSEGEEDRREEVGRRIAADPRAEDRGRAGDEREHCELREGDADAARGCGDPEPLGDVVHHEPDHEERAELELAGGERRPDREPLAEVVDPDPDRDEQGEREARGARLTAREPCREEHHPE